METIITRQMFVDNPKFYEIIEEEINRTLGETLNNFVECPTTYLRLFLSKVNATFLSPKMEKKIIEILVKKHSFKENEITNVYKSSDTFPCVIVDINLDM